MLESILCTFIDRKWMRAAKAWRITLALPEDSMLAVALTSLIERKVSVEISAAGVAVSIDPVFILDVPSKGKRFFLVIETVYEHQSDHGAILTEMTGETAVVTIRPESGNLMQSDTSETARKGTITETAIKGLHSSFFKNNLFCDFIGAKTGSYTKDYNEVKLAFKDLMGVKSCTEIDQSDFDLLLVEFNGWLKEVQHC